MPTPTMSCRATTPPARRPSCGPTRWAAGVALALALAMSGCGTTPTAQVPAGLWQDALFTRPAVLPSADQALALSAPMRAFVDGELARHTRRLGLQAGLVAALRASGPLALEYDASFTRNAAEAFEQRAGNCLSLVLMTAAMARQLDLEVTYQATQDDGVWSRSGGLMLRSGHVNLRLGPRRLDRAAASEAIQLTVDFVDPASLRGLRTRVLREATVLAMYLNNRAAETLAAGDLDGAYWWARAAVAQDPALGDALNTLGVVYLRRGAAAAAEQALRLALARRTAESTVLANLAQAVAQQGRADEAASMRQRLAALQPHPAFEAFDLGLAAARQGDWPRARRLFEQEARRTAYHADVHYWLGLAHYRLGDLPQAREQLALAARLGGTPQSRDRYGAKLAWLQAQAAR